MAGLDFKVEVRERDDGYELAVDSRAGGATMRAQRPFDELALKNRLLALENALLRSSGGRRVVPTDDEREVQEFGRQMFDWLLRVAGRPGQLRGPRHVRNRAPDPGARRATAGAPGADSHRLAAYHPGSVRRAADAESAATGSIGSPADASSIGSNRELPAPTTALSGP